MVPIPCGPSLASTLHHARRPCLANGQPQATAIAAAVAFAAGVEHVEHSFPHLGSDARPLVHHPDLELPVVGIEPALDAHLAARREKRAALSMTLTSACSIRAG